MNCYSTEEEAQKFDIKSHRKELKLENIVPGFRSTITCAFWTALKSSKMTKFL